jgi:hypothetical protein
MLNPQTKCTRYQAQEGQLTKQVQEINTPIQEGIEGAIASKTNSQAVVQMEAKRFRGDRTGTIIIGKDVKEVEAHPLVITKPRWALQTTWVVILRALSIHNRTTRSDQLD